MLIQTMNERLEDAVRQSAAIFVDYVPNDHRSEFEQKVAELAGRRLAPADGE